MPNTAINIQDLSKRYSLKASSRFDRSLASFAAKLVTGQLNSSNPKDTNNDVLWALKDINLNIQQGEVHGIIGPNGSGKSTLLKLIARVIPPTTGTIQIAGRVGSMLELGIGFHPDLTGRENVYFAGALLGVPKRTIRAKIDEIIDYSGIPDFIDIPVNKYSSGMRVRLGFSLMTIIQPEILLIDEVLGVGDAEFQEKSRDRIKSMVHNGNAVLVVSHNSHVMADMCDRITRLELGAIIDQGDPSAVTKKYLADTLKVQTT